MFNKVADCFAETRGDEVASVAKEDSCPFGAFGVLPSALADRSGEIWGEMI
jgi:hypothetical protein